MNYLWNETNNFNEITLIISATYSAPLVVNSHSDKFNFSTFAKYLIVLQIASHPLSPMFER